MVTYNSILNILKKASGDKFEVFRETFDRLWEDSTKQVRNGSPLGILAQTARANYSRGGGNFIEDN